MTAPFTHLAIIIFFFTSLPLLQAEEKKPVDQKPASSNAQKKKKKANAQKNKKVNWKKSKSEWKKILTPHQFYICRQRGTEKEYSGKYWKFKTEGTYQCVCCKLDLFDSKTKFVSGTGWPSFYQPVNKKAIVTRVDKLLATPRTELRCSRCDSHLGHVFNGGPKPTGKRYCINSASLLLIPKNKIEKKSKK